MIEVTELLVDGIRLLLLGLNLDSYFLYTGEAHNSALFLSMTIIERKYR